MKKYATLNWYTAAFDAEKIAGIIPVDYEYSHGKTWPGGDLEQAIEWMRERNEDGRLLFRVCMSVEFVDVHGVSAPQPLPETGGRIADQGCPYDHCEYSDNGTCQCAHDEYMEALPEYRPGTEQEREG